MKELVASVDKDWKTGCFMFELASPVPDKVAHHFQAEKWVVHQNSKMFFPVTTGDNIKDFLGQVCALVGISANKP